MRVVHVVAGVSVMALSLLGSTLGAQNQGATVDTLRKLAPNVYITCDDCGDDYLRTEIAFVNFVRDRQQADVHILVTEQSTGGGGDEYTLEFIGQNAFAGMADTLKYFSRDSDTEDMIRSGLGAVIKRGLVRYAARTPIAPNLTIQYTGKAAKEKVVDKWNYWVFETELNGWFQGERSYHEMNLSGSVYAKRTTKELITWAGFWGSYQQKRYESEGDWTTLLSRSKGFDAGMIFSLGDHWGMGASQEVSSSSYSNRKLRVRLAPAIEYNIYPYSESTRRQLRISYEAALTYDKYEEETIFGKMEEGLVSQALSVNLTHIRPWGSITTSVSGSNYLHDFHKNYLQLFGQVSFRLIEGLSLNASGSVARLHSQLSLRKGTATEQEIVARQRELATSYNYWASVGISYTFGSIYNNIVNARFGMGD